MESRMLFRELQVCMHAVTTTSSPLEGASQSLAGAMAQMAKFGVKTAPDKTIDLPDGTQFFRTALIRF